MDPSRIRDLREKVGLTQPELARLCGVSQQAIQQVEAGKIQKPRFLPDLAKHLRTTPAYLTRETNDPQGFANYSGLMQSSIRRGDLKSGSKPMDETRYRLIRVIMEMSDKRVAALAMWLEDDEGDSDVRPSRKGKTL